MIYFSSRLSSENKCFQKANKISVVFPFQNVWQKRKIYRFCTEKQKIPDHSGIWILFDGVASVELIVFAFFGNQLIVITPFDNLTIVDDHDDIGVFDGR